MKRRNQRLRFQTPHIIQLSESSNTLAGVQMAKVGNYYHAVHGDFEITHQLLSEIITNHNNNAYGQKIFVDIAHNPDNGAAAHIQRLYVEGEWLLADLELTPFGRKEIEEKSYIYLSIEYHEHWTNNAKQDVGAVLLGAGLTIRPFIKGQMGITLAEKTGNNTMNYTESLRTELARLKAGKMLSDELIKQFKVELQKLTASDAKQALLDQYKIIADLTVKQLKEHGDTNGTINLSITTPAEGKQLSDEAVNAMVDKRLADAKAADTKKLADDATTLTVKHKLFTDAIEATELDDDVKKRLSENKKHISVHMPDDGVKELAETYIETEHQVSIARQLGDMGYEVKGSPQIHVDESNSIKQLNETVNKRLGLADRPDSIKYESTGGTLPTANKVLAEKVLKIYDAEHREQLLHEAKMLNDATGTISDTAIPGAFERNVLEQAIHSLIGLQYVNSGTADFGESLYLPYSYRKQNSATSNDTRIYEGGSIQRAGVVQTGETAYPIPQKLSFEVSDELRYLTSARRLNWEAVAENQKNATRIIGEDTDSLIFNEQVQASDEYMPIVVSNENLVPQVSAGKKVVLIGGDTVTTVCRPRTIFDLQGSQIGNTSNPVIMSFDGSDINEYNPLAVNSSGASTLPYGNYYVLDYDIGETYIVNKDGGLVDPDGKAWNISYSKATNLAYFDTDVPSGSKDKEYWDKFLRVYNLRKTLLEDTRYYRANFGLMSGNYMAEVEQAEKFSANHRVPATELSANGNLGRIKDVPNFKTSAPGLWMGDRRAIIGERNVSRFRITKPWTMGQLENQKDENNRFTGKKEAYGDQFLILHTPKFLKAALTSIVLYSSSLRVARANI